MKTLLIAATITITSFHCSDLSDLGTGQKSSEDDCWTELPADLAREIDRAYEQNAIERDHSIAQERERLNVTPLKPDMLLASSVISLNRYLPEVDPFPKSIVVVGESYDIRASGYELNHGKMGFTRVYETEPGSKKFFIVDRIGGDGIGGNGGSVVAESVENGLLKFSNEPQAGHSWHSWHTSPSNYIVRATQNPEDDLQETINICGCGPNGYESEKGEEAFNADAAAPVYNIAIFFLPGTDLPTIGPENAFEATFKRRYYEKIYVPREGFTCKEHEVVC